ncbi:DUF4113 domain-containing protein [Escherichia coli]|nr:DUF4113 domain-containing protein [Escherichia coli]
MNISKSGNYTNLCTGSKREMLSQCYTTKWRDIPLTRRG